MSKNESLSPSLVEDSAGTFFAAVGSEVGDGLVDVRQEAVSPVATYGDACVAFGQNDANARFVVPATAREALATLPGLRVIVKTPLTDSAGNRGIYPVPGIVLPDATVATGVRVGILTGPNDIIVNREQLQAAVEGGLSDMQIDMLRLMAAEHAPSSGSHVAAPELPSKQRVNFADVGHAAVLASAKSPIQIHDRVHQVTAKKTPDDMVIVPSTLAPSVAQTGAIHIGTPNGVRLVGNHIISGNAICDVIIAKVHQDPSRLQRQLDLTPVELTAGMIMGATSTHPSEYPRPNVSWNANQMAVQAGV